MNHLTPREVATRLKVSLRTVEQLRATGTGPAYIRVGHQVRYPEAAVTAWEAASLAKTTEGSN